MKEFVEKLIKRLENRKQGKFNLYCDALDYAIRTVNELAEEYNNGWIPCSERLPSVGVTVLCYWKKCDRCNNIISYYYELMHKNEDCQWISDFGMCCGDVIAWQPLPQPYNEGSE